MVYLDFGGSWDRDDVVTLSEKPCQSNLTRRSVVLLSNLLEPLSDLQDVREVLLGHPADHIIRSDIQKC